MFPNPHDAPVIAAIGDVHGHLQLGLCMVARWQRERQLELDAVVLCGDVGSFAREDELDNATRRHARTNPCELEFLQQWAVSPQAPWLARIFAPVGEGGLGLTCPVIMVHGNHEGFTALEKHAALPRPTEPVPVAALPTVDLRGFVRYLPSGWRCRTARGLVVGAVGGIEHGQRRARYHPLAYLDDDAVVHLLGGPPVDVLVTHQGPSERQGSDKGSDTLQLLLEAGHARVWFHGHSLPDPRIARGGPGDRMLVVPLGDVAFPGRGPEADDPGHDAWALAWMGETVEVERARPDFWRDYRRTRWLRLPDGRLVAPELAGEASLR